MRDLSNRLHLHTKNTYTVSLTDRIHCKEKPPEAKEEELVTENNKLGSTLSAMTQQKPLIPCGNLLSSHFDKVNVHHSPMQYHHSSPTNHASAQGGANAFYAKPPAISCASPSLKVPLNFPIQQNVHHAPSTNSLPGNKDAAVDKQKQKFSQQKPQQQQVPRGKKVHKSGQSVVKREEDNEPEVEEDEDSDHPKIKRSRHMPLACPFHYLSHTRCDTKTCSTRKLYSKNSSPLHDYQYRVLKTLYSNHKPHRTVFMKRVKVLFRQYAPDGQKAFDELLKELKQQRIVSQLEIDQCVQQEQEQLQQKRKSPKTKKKVLKSASTNGASQTNNRVKKAKNTSSNGPASPNSPTQVGSKRKADQLSLFAQQQQKLFNQLEDGSVSTPKSAGNSSGSAIATIDEEILDFDPALFADYGRTYNLRNNKKRKMEEPYSLEPSEETADSEKEFEDDADEEDEKLSTSESDNSTGCTESPMINSNANNNFINNTCGAVVVKEAIVSPNTSMGNVHALSSSNIDNCPVSIQSNSNGSAVQSSLASPASSKAASIARSHNHAAVNTFADPSKGLLWYEYDIDMCDSQVFIKSSDGNWIVQENGGEKCVDTEDEEDSDSDTQSSVENGNKAYHCHNYYYHGSSMETDYDYLSMSSNEVDIAHLLIVMMNNKLH